MTTVTLLVLLCLMWPSSLLGAKTFLIRSESSKRCLRAEDSAIIMADCDKEHTMQKFQWISTDQLVNVGTSQCLSVSSLQALSAVTLSTCDANSDLQKWECKNETSFGVQKADLYMSYTDSKKVVLFSDTGAWSQWKIYSTDENLCANPYEEIYTLKGNSNGQPCKFPFKFENKSYVDCTTARRYDGQRESNWCSTTLDYDADKLYGYCPSTYISESFWATDSVNGVYYQINSDSALTWYQARISCQQQDAGLLSITELHEQAYISGLLHGLTTRLWIGLNSLDFNVGWRWDGGDPFRYLNWLPGNPSEDPDVNCVAINPEISTQWESKKCEQKLGYICKKDYRKPFSVPFPGTSDPTFCPSSWFPYNGYCYYLVHENKTWQDAVLSCRKEESDLASLHNIEEASAVASHFQFGDAEYVWLGLNDLKTQLFYEWSDGSPVAYTTWQRGEPSHLNSREEDCVALSTKDGQWADKLCERFFPFICKRKSLPNDQGMVDVHPGCDEGWKRHGSYCYLIGESLSTFSEANSTCNHHGAFLMTIEDRIEQAYITSLIGFRPEKYFWTGLSDLEENNTFTWANKERVLYTHWNADMPDRKQGCVAMRTGNKAGLWDVINCKEKTKYVCKKWAQGVTPPPIPTTTAEPTCPTNWTILGDACFKFYSEEYYELKTWYEARDFCRAIGGDLLSITSIWDDIAVTRMMRKYKISYSKRIWMGLVHRSPEEGSVWSDGSPLTYEGWNFQKLNNNNGRQICGSVYGYSLYWQLIDCDTARQWICKIKKGVILKEEPKPTVYEFTSDGWLIYNDSQYYISKDEMPMEKAQEFCNRNFSHLVTINSELERKFLLKYIAAETSETYYIGLCLGLDREFTWMDGSLVDFVAWDSNQPDFAHYDEFCTEMNKETGLWNDINCGMPTRFICERTNSSNNATFAPTLPAPVGGCPSDWLSFGQKCYGIFGTRKDEQLHWDNARRECQSFGGNLVTINSNLVQSFLMSNLRNVKADVWIGLHDKNKAGKFVWTDQSGVYYTNWDKGHPLFYRHFDSVDCVTLQSGSVLNAGTWIEQECHLNKGYICQKYMDPSFPVFPTTPPLRDYYNYGDASYKFDKTKRSWDEARHECLKDNAQLASILDEYTTSFLNLHLVKHMEPFWIGLHSSNETKNTYKWVDNWKVRYTKWAAEEPRENLACVYVDTDGQWKTAPCNQSYSSICKQTNVVAPTDPPVAPGTCPNTTKEAWIPFRNHCYLFESSIINPWAQASLECLHHGGRLTSVEDSAELDFLRHHTELLSDQMSTFWIGLYKNVEDKWLWLDNTPLDFINWKDEAPHGDIYKCAMMDAIKGTWDIKICGKYRGYICKALKTPPLPAEKTAQRLGEKPSHGMTIGVVVSVILVVSGTATAVYFVYRRKNNEPQLETGFSNNIYFGSGCDGAAQDAKVLVENIEENENS
ncbi:macrophage mannose receptor 1-like [Dendropsophus ebraccatus]|uniref:macrophage mannose receptor 1-like n=1 Tax=Dendropsophus ebraccatus TaxID=150705 RepID=UPI003831367C